jgi:hypothetical protein
MSRPLREIIADMVERRRELAKYSMETGIPKHGDLTQLDRQIAELADKELEQGGRSR